MPYKDPEKQKEYLKNHYKLNTETYQERVSFRKKLLRVYTDSVKESLGCTDCGITNPVVLVFHHTDPSNKVMTVSKMIGDTISKEKVDIEISKCIVLCANCHLIRHNKRHTV